MTNQQEKCIQFARLHQTKGGFIIPNPWDVGSARLLQGLGFKALATTSSGFARTLGKADGAVTLEEKLIHCKELASATDIPINVDFENGFADTPEQIAENIRKLSATGVAGCSIEDFDRNTKRIYPSDIALERIQSAVEAVTSLDMPFQLTARAENLIRKVDDLDDTINRLQTFEAAGADVLYAPGIKTLDDLKATTDSLNKPFNVLSVFLPNASVDELIDAGAKRISIGGALASVCARQIIDAGKEMLESGSFNWTS